MLWPIPMVSDLAYHLLTNCLHSATMSLLFLEYNGAYFHQQLNAIPCTLKDFPRVFTLLALSGHSILAQLSPQWPPLTTWFHAVTPPSIPNHLTILFSSLSDIILCMCLFLSHPPESVSSIKAVVDLSCAHEPYCENGPWLTVCSSCTTA